MDRHDLNRNLGMLCCFCDYLSYKLPDVEGLSSSERETIEELCKLCIENSRLTAINQ